MWKSADICAIPKKIPPKNIEQDLHPISLTPVLSKDLEGFVVDCIFDIIKDKLDPLQYHSLKGSSTTLAPIDMLDYKQKALEKPNQAARILFIDFSKAFDRINHSILLQKLHPRNTKHFTEID